MSAESDPNPYSDSHLESPEYRKRLRRKLNTLIAVLEVASAKVRRSLAGPDPDVERLTRIYKNLRDTLQVCLRARSALERQEELPADLPRHLELAALPEGSAGAGRLETPARGTEVELGSPEERDKFARLGPIHAREVRGCDLDLLCARLLQES